LLFWHPVLMDKVNIIISATKDAVSQREFTAGRLSGKQPKLQAAAEAEDLIWPRPAEKTLSGIDKALEIAENKVKELLKNTLR
jgi:hypothetical protein